MVSTPEGEGEPLELQVRGRGAARRRSSASTRASRSARAETEVADEVVDTEVERIREGFARLEPVEREAAEGDSLLIDFEGLIDGTAFEGGKAEDYLLALGSGR